MHTIQVLFLFLLVFASVSPAQIGSQSKVRYPTVSSSFTFRNWSKEEAGEESNIMEITTPVAVFYPVTRSFTIAMTTATVFSSLNAEIMNGIADTQMKGFYTMADDTIFVSVGLNLPSGESSLSKNELEVSRALSENVLGFERNKLGGGLDIHLSSGIARVYGPVAIGGGMGYLIKGKYEYLEEKESAYKPGDELTLTAGADWAIGNFVMRGDLIYSIYGQNKLNGDEIFKEGNKVSAEGTLFYSIGRVTLLASAREIIRGKMEYRGSAGFLVEEDKKSSGNQLNLDGVAYLKAQSKLILKVMTEARFIGKNENTTAEAFAVGFGAGLTVTPLRGMVIDATGKYLTGQADDEVDLAGLGVVVGLKWEF